jgi:hypothetical protein
VRWVLVIAFCIAVGATTWAGARDEQSGLHVTIGYALPESDVEDSDNELGRKYWDVFPPVTVESERRCDRAELTTRADDFFNGERGFGSPEEPVESELNGDGYRFEDRAEGPTALAGETIRITATARCVSGGSFTTVSARREFELPTASCDRGPLRVGELEGRVKAVDWDHEEQGERVLQPGFLITPGSELTVEPGGRAEIGAPECHGLRVILYEGEHTVGSYSREGRGDSFSTERIVGEGDSHAGAVLVPDRATVWPLGFRCRGCQATGPSWYEIRSTAERVTVRVFRGEVLVGGPEDPPTLRVPAGHQASVLCEAGTCRAGHLRLFQAKEPWSTPPEGLLDRLPRRVAGADPLLSAFAPPFSDIQAERLPAAAREPDQVVIAWSREVRRDDGSHEWELGFLGWQRVAPKRWELVYEQPVECCPAMGIETGDLTGDGHADALTHESQGSGGCGFARVLISSDGRLREEFAYDGCDYSMTIEKGAVVLRHGVGPCPWGEGAHCSGGTRTVVKRWIGSKLVTSSETVECHAPRLDPAHGCLPPR